MLCGHKMLNIAKMDKFLGGFNGYLRSNAEVWEGRSRLGDVLGVPSPGVAACEEGLLGQWLL